MLDYNEDFQIDQQSLICEHILLFNVSTRKYNFKNIHIFFPYLPIRYHLSHQSLIEMWLISSDLEQSDYLIHIKCTACRFQLAESKKVHETDILIVCPEHEI